MENWRKTNFHTKKIHSDCSKLLKTQNFYFLIDENFKMNMRWKFEAYFNISLKMLSNLWRVPFHRTQTIFTLSDAFHPHQQTNCAWSCSTLFIMPSEARKQEEIFHLTFPTCFYSLRQFFRFNSAKWKQLPNFRCEKWIWFFGFKTSKDLADFHENFTFNRLHFQPFEIWGSFWIFFNYLRIELYVCVHHSFSGGF